jgi:Na+-transporting NADH:ubiquinone oxidoreductase subunit A
MKMTGGYLPKIAGQPSGKVRTADVPARLLIALHQDGLVFHPAVPDGAQVHAGQIVADRDHPGGKLALTAPAGGSLQFEVDTQGVPVRLVLAVSDHTPPRAGKRFIPGKATPAELRQALASGGVWQRLWSSANAGVPPLDPATGTPSRIVVNTVLSEPFRTDSTTLIQEDREAFLAGLAFLPSLLADGGRVHLTTTKGQADALEKLVAPASLPQAPVIETVPLRYPIEHPQVLCDALCRTHGGIQPGESLWVLDSQAVAAIGSCLKDGIALHSRLLAIGGPGATQPMHVRARIGTPLNSLLDATETDGSRLALRGGLFRGEPVTDACTVEAHDDALFLLPRTDTREFLGFVTPGFDRRSILPCFASVLTGAADRHVSVSLRGERRPCIACGLCESVCPVDLMPQVLHRYLYSDAIDNVEATGIDRCIDCGLCTYVCPSKIDLTHQFKTARARIREEHAEAAAAEAAHRHREDARRKEPAKQKDAKR